MEKLTKQDLKGHDIFVSNIERLSDWGYEYRREMMVALTLIAIIALAWAGYGTYTSQREDSAQEVLFHAEKTMASTMETFDAPKDAQGKPVKDAKPKAVATGNIDTDYKTSVEQLKDVIFRFPKTQSAVLAALDLSHLYYTYKKYAEAIPLLDQASKEVEHPVTKAFVLLNLGLNQEAKGDCKSAISNWMKVADDRKMSSFQGNALVKSGLCYEKLGEKDKAADIYKKFSQAEKARDRIVEGLAAENNINMKIPMQFQPKDKVAKFEKALSKSDEIQSIQALLSDRDAVKAAKRYLLLLNYKGHS